MLSLHYQSIRCHNKGIKVDIPVVDGASVIVIIAWQLSIERSHTDTPDKVIVCEDNLARVILGARVEVVAWGTKGWNAYTHAKVPKFTLNFHAVAWGLVALPKVVITVLTAGCAELAWRRDAAALITVATAQAYGFKGTCRDKEMSAGRLMTKKKCTECHLLGPS
jgi:hypothetical protein